MICKKGYSPVLDVDVWRLQQFVPEGDAGRWWQISFCIFPIQFYDEEYGRSFIAGRVREHRRALRLAIHNHLKEKARVVPQDR